MRATLLRQDTVGQLRQQRWNTAHPGFRKLLEKLRPGGGGCGDRAGLSVAPQGESPGQMAPSGSSNQALESGGLRARAASGSCLPGSTSLKEQIVPAAVVTPAWWLKAASSLLDSYYIRGVGRALWA